MLNVQNMTGCTEMKKVPIFAETKNIKNKICHWPEITVNSLIIGIYCQNPIHPNYIMILYSNNCIISQSLFSPLPDVVETKKDQNWKILSRKNCSTAEIEAAVILRPPFKDKLQRKQTRNIANGITNQKNYGLYHGT